ESGAIDILTISDLELGDTPSGDVHLRIISTIKQVGFVNDEMRIIDPRFRNDFHSVSIEREITHIPVMTECPYDFSYRPITIFAGQCGIQGPHSVRGVEEFHHFERLMLFGGAVAPKPHVRVEGISVKIQIVERHDVNAYSALFHSGRFLSLDA